MIQIGKYRQNKDIFKELVYDIWAIIGSYMHMWSKNLYQFTSFKKCFKELYTKTVIYTSSYI